LRPDRGRSVEIQLRVLVKQGRGCVLSHRSKSATLNDSAHPILMLLWQIVEAMLQTMDKKQRPEDLKSWLWEGGRISSKVSHARPLRFHRIAVY
jgi:hypothetical protein